MEPATPPIQADTHNIQNDSLDCGIKALGWCRGSKCQSLATTRNFIIFFAIVGALQGATETYFRISAKQAALDHDFDLIVLDWLLVSSGILKGILAIGITFYSQKYHPMAWLGGSIIFQSVVSFLTIIPTITHFPYEKVEQPIYESPLCDTQSNGSQLEKPHSMTTLVLLFVLQLGIALASTVFYTIGFTYLDDNTRSLDVAILMGIALGTYVWGTQIGTAISLQVDSTPLGWWLGWAIIVPLLLTFGILISLFPRKLIKAAVRQAANKIIERSSRHISLEDNINFIADFTLFATIKRLITNKILMFNLMAFVFIETANINFFLQEQSYLQSRFYLPTSEANGLLDEWTSRFLSYMLKPPIVGICILVSGLVISRIMPKARTIAIWNVIMGAIVCVLFISYIFIHCSSGKIANAYRGKVTQPYCSKQCVCSSDAFFAPVCPQNSKMTYFSPCHAGCKNSFYVNNVLIYQNCSCGIDPDVPVESTIATTGACNLNDCQINWTIFQILVVVAAALLGTCKIGRILITLRSVLPQDKSLALALELCLAGLFVYIPGKVAYDSISSSACQYWSKDRKVCYLQESPLHGDIINILSAILMLFGVLFDILVAIFSKDLNCFTKEQCETDLELFTPLQMMRSSRIEPNSQPDGNDSGDDARQPLYIRDSREVPQSSVLQNSPRVIGRRSISPENRSKNIVYAQVDFPKTNKTENTNIQNETEPDEKDEKKMNYAQLVFELKSKNAKPSNVTNEEEEHLDFRLQNPDIGEPSRENTSMPNKDTNNLRNLPSTSKSVEYQPKETDF